MRESIAWSGVRGGKGLLHCVWKKPIAENPVSIDRCVDKPSMVCINNGILFSLEKERNSDTCNNIDELEEVLLGAISSSQKG